MRLRRCFSFPIAGVAGSGGRGAGEAGRGGTGSGGAGTGSARAGGTGTGTGGPGTGATGGAGTGGSGTGGVGSGGSGIVIDDVIVIDLAPRAASAAIALMAALSACFDPADRMVALPEPSCPASAGLPRRGRPAVPRDGGPSLSADEDAGGSHGGDSLATMVRFAVIGDYGLAGENEGKVADLVTSWNPDFVITTGDNNYFQGAATTIDQNIGKYYCQFIGNYLGEPGEGSLINRFWPSPGNHDWATQELRPYTNYFTLPGNERYYDVARGLVHLYALDSDFNEPDGNTEISAQAAWLKGPLSSSTACFDVVYFHHPPYSSGPHGSSFEMRWPFEAWGADVVMAGHDHLYERFEVGQIPYFTVGLGGSSIYDFVTVLPESRMQYNETYGALRVTADRHGMTFEFVNVLGAVVDTFTVAKECPAPSR